MDLIGKNFSDIIQIYNVYDMKKKNLRIEKKIEELGFAWAEPNVDESC
jgi:hypothetical protein